VVSTAEIKDFHWAALAAGGGVDRSGRKGCLSVLGAAEASKEEKWPQLADPEVLT